MKVQNEVKSRYAVKLKIRLKSHNNTITLTSPVMQITKQLIYTKLQHKPQSNINVMEQKKHLHCIGF